MGDEMRDFKFRAWHRGYSELDPAQMIYEEAPGRSFVWLEEGQPVEIMQFTGLLDKNGVEIYEGDIVRVWGHPQLHQDWIWTATVDWLENAPQFNFRRIEKPRITWDMGHNDCEVIGNIHENPELL